MVCQCEWSHYLNDNILSVSLLREEKKGAVAYLAWVPISCSTIPRTVSVVLTLVAYNMRTPVRIPGYEGADAAQTSRAKVNCVGCSVI